MVLEDRVIQAKNNTNTLNDLLTEYKPYIQKVVYETCQRYVEWGHDEELSIGLLAFEEAVNRFQPEKGSFIALANRTIKSRVIDYLRKENRHIHKDIEDVQNEVSYSFTNSLAEEIEELQLYLTKFDIVFQDLPNVSPVKRNLGEELKQTAKITASNTEFMKQLIGKKQLPVKAIAESSQISHKKIERNRIYLITMSLIWYLDLPLLQGYIK